MADKLYAIEDFWIAGEINGRAVMSMILSKRRSNGIV
jgi:hypothetical protein